MFYALLYGRNISLPGEDLNFIRAGPLLGFRSICSGISNFM